MSALSLSLHFTAFYLTSYGDKVPLPIVYSKGYYFPSIFYTYIKVINIDPFINDTHVLSFIVMLLTLLASH